MTKLEPNSFSWRPVQSVPIQAALICLLGCSILFARSKSQSDISLYQGAGKMQDELKKFNERPAADSLRKALIEGEAYKRLSPHEKFERLRADERWKDVPPLVLASSLGDLEDTRFFLSQGESPDTPDENGVTGLMNSARFANLPLLQVFLDAGAKLEQKDHRGATALIYAAENGNSLAVKTLLDRGGDPLTKSSSGMTLLHAAVASGDIKTIEAVFALGLDTNAKTEDGSTPLIWAAQGRNPHLIQLLLSDKRTEVNAATEYGTTALIAATTDDDGFRSANRDCVALLIAHGASVNAKDRQGFTPLMGASFYGDLEVVKILVDNGADLSARDNQGQTALSLAKQSRRHDIAKFLEN